MQTVLLVCPMDLGQELDVRRAHEAFLAEALTEGSGVNGLVAFIGSGYYAMEITVADGDFQENFHRFLATPEIRTLFDRLRRHVHDLPRPDDQTADMPLATAMLLWRSAPGDDPVSV